MHGSIIPWLFQTIWPHPFLVAPAQHFKNNWPINLKIKSWVVVQVVLFDVSIPGVFPSAQASKMVSSFHATYFIVLNRQSNILDESCYGKDSIANKESDLYGVDVDRLLAYKHDFNNYLSQENDFLIQRNIWEQTRDTDVHKISKKMLHNSKDNLQVYWHESYL